MWTCHRVLYRREIETRQARASDATLGTVRPLEFTLGIARPSFNFCRMSNEVEALVRGSSTCIVGMPVLLLFHLFVGGVKQQHTLIRSG